MFELDIAVTVFLRLSSSQSGNEFDKYQMLQRNLIYIKLLLPQASEG